MLGRFWRWFVGPGERQEEKKERIEVHVHVHLDGHGGSVANRPVVTMTEGQVSSPGSPRITTSINSDDVSAREIADLMKESGIEKAVDKTGSGSVTKSEGKSVDSQIQSLRNLKRP